MPVIPNHARLRLEEGKLSLGIVPVHDLLGVGEGLQHHYATCVVHRVRGRPSLALAVSLRPGLP